jgi:hypothetical protein
VCVCVCVCLEGGGALDSIKGGPGEGRGGGG